MSKYMGQIMAECDCQHQACEMRGYCMVDRIEELEGSIKPKIVAFILGCIFIASLDYGDVWICAGQCDPLAELKGQDDE